jgi:chemotaxis response regulator CheB
VVLDDFAKVQKCMRICIPHHLVDFYIGLSRCHKTSQASKSGNGTSAMKQLIKRVQTSAVCLINDDSAYGIVIVIDLESKRLFRLPFESELIRAFAAVVIFTTSAQEEQVNEELTTSLVCSADEFIPDDAMEVSTASNDVVFAAAAAVAAASRCSSAVFSFAHNGGSERAAWL